MSEINDSPIVINLDSKRCPEIKTYKVGQKVTLTIEAEVQSLSKGYVWDESDDKKLRATLKITKVMPEEDDDEATKMANKGHY